MFAERLAKQFGLFVSLRRIAEFFSSCCVWLVGVSAIICGSSRTRRPVDRFKAAFQLLAASRAMLGGDSCFQCPIGQRPFEHSTAALNPCQAGRVTI